MALVAGSDARVISPLFTDLDETPAATATTPTVAVSSLLAGTLTAPAVAAWDGHAGLYRATLTAAAHLTGLDQLTLTWTGDVGGAARVLASTEEVAGGVYVRTDVLAAQRTLPDTGVNLAALRVWRDAFEWLAERARGVAFVPRLAVEDHPATERGVVSLRWPRAREIRAVWVDGVAQDDLAAWCLDQGAGTVTGPFTRPTRIAYSHGHDQPPPALVVACRDYVRAKALSDTSDQQRTVLSFTNLASGETYRYGTADWKAGRWTGMETIDSLIASVDDERIPGVG